MDLIYLYINFNHHKHNIYINFIKLQMFIKKCFIYCLTIHLYNL